MRARRRLALVPSLLTLFAAATPARADAPQEPPIVARYEGHGQFIDDPLAVSDDGKSVAFLTTDGVSQCQLHVARPDDKSDATVACDTVTALRIEFVDELHVLLVSAQGDREVGVVYHRDSGAEKPRLGPATHVGLATVDGARVLASYDTTTRGAATTYTLATWRPTDLKPIAKKSYTATGGKLKLAGATLSPLVPVGDFTQLIVERAGEYDKAHDIRRPDTAARLELASGKLVAERDIGDRAAFARVVGLRGKEPGRSQFLRWADDLTRIQSVAADDTVTPIDLGRPLDRYDPTTLRWQRSGDATWLSLTIDPVNAAAVAAKKADVDWIDLYRLSDGKSAAEPVARINGDKRPSVWHIGGGRLALLRKTIGVGRGGPLLEVRQLPR